MPAHAALKHTVPALLQSVLGWVSGVVWCGAAPLNAPELRTQRQARRTGARWCPFPVTSDFGSRPPPYASADSAGYQMGRPVPAKQFRGTTRHPPRLGSRDARCRRQESMERPLEHLAGVHTIPEVDRRAVVCHEICQVLAEFAALNQLGLGNLQPLAAVLVERREGLGHKGLVLVARHGASLSEWAVQPRASIAASASVHDPRPRATRAIAGPGLPVTGWVVSQTR